MEPAITTPTSKPLYLYQLVTCRISTQAEHQGPFTGTLTLGTLTIDHLRLRGVLGSTCAHPGLQSTRHNGLYTQNKSSTGYSLRYYSGGPGRSSKHLNTEYLAQTIFIIPYIETQSPHSICTWTLPATMPSRRATLKLILFPTNSEVAARHKWQTILQALSGAQCRSNLPCTQHPIPTITTPSSQTPESDILRTSICLKDSVFLNRGVLEALIEESWELVYYNSTFNNKNKGPVMGPLVPSEEGPT